MPNVQSLTDWIDTLNIDDKVVDSENANDHVRGRDIRSWMTNLDINDDNDVDNDVPDIDNTDAMDIDNVHTAPCPNTTKYLYQKSALDPFTYEDEKINQMPQSYIWTPIPLNNVETIFPPEYKIYEKDKNQPQKSALYDKEEYKIKYMPSDYYAKIHNYQRNSIPYDAVAWAKSFFGIDLSRHRSEKDIIDDQLECQITTSSYRMVEPVDGISKPENIVDNSVPMIDIHGSTLNGATVCISVLNFCPYFYVSKRRERAIVPDEEKKQISLFIEKLRQHDNTSGEHEKFVNDTVEDLKNMLSRKEFMRILHKKYENEKEYEKGEKLLQKYISDIITRDNMYLMMQDLAETKKGDNMIKSIELDKGRSCDHYRINESTFFKIILKSPRNIVHVRTLFEENQFNEIGDFQLFEAGTQFKHRFYIDKDIGGFSWVSIDALKSLDVSGTLKKGYAISNYHYIIDADDLNVIREERKTAPLYYLSYDGEMYTDGARFPTPENEPIIQWGMKTGVFDPSNIGNKSPLDNFWGVFTTGGVRQQLHPNCTLYTFDKSVEGEREMIRAILYFKLVTQYDIGLGWNIINFDLPYLIARAKLLNIQHALQYGKLWGEQMILREHVTASRAHGSKTTHAISGSGIWEMDGMDIVMRLYKLKSYALSEVAEWCGLGRKVDQPYSTIGPTWFEKPEKLGIYTATDVDLPPKILNHLSIFDLTAAFCRVTHLDTEIWANGEQLRVLMPLMTYLSKEENKVFVPYHRVEKQSDNPNKGNKFKGATVIEPVRGLHKRKIALVDFAAMYPNIMRLLNLCYTTLVIGPIENYGLTENDVNRIRIDDETEHVFVKPHIKEGILPKVLTYLLDARGRAKAIMKKHFLAALAIEKEIRDTYPDFINEDIKKFIDKLKIIEEKTKWQALFAEKGNDVLPELRTQYPSFKFRPFDAIVDALTPEQKKQWDAKITMYKDHMRENANANHAQLAFKIICNTMYGFTGASEVGKLPCPAIAATVTRYGRLLIDICKLWAKEKFDLETIYGDSVTPDTPILCLDIIDDKESIIYKTIDTIGNGIWTTSIEGDDKEECMPLQNLKVWSDDGFVTVKKVIRHKCTKNMKRVVTSTGVVDVTDDHSLLTGDGIEVCARDIQKGDALLHAYLPYMSDDLNNTENISKIDKGIIFTTIDKLKAAKIYHDAIIRGYVVHIEIDEHHLNNINIYIENKNTSDTPQDQYNVTGVYDLPKYTGYVYDLQTKNHHFMAGVGQIVVHNTDSVMVELPEGITVVEALKLGKEIEVYFNMKLVEMRDELYPNLIGDPRLPPAMVQEFEKLYHILVLYEKKRYSGYYTAGNGSPNDPWKVENKGSEALRRDATLFLKEIITRGSKIVLKRGDVDACKIFLNEQIEALCTGKVSLDKLIQTAQYSKSVYKNSPPHVAVVDHLKQLALEGNDTPIPPLGSRVPYFITEGNIIKEGISALARHPEIYMKYNMALNLPYYVSRIVKPLLRIFSPIFYPGHPQAVELTKVLLFDKKYMRMIIKASLKNVKTLFGSRLVITSPCILCNSRMINKSSSTIVCGDCFCDLIDFGQEKIDVIITKYRMLLSQTSKNLRVDLKNCKDCAARTIAKQKTITMDTDAGKTPEQIEKEKDQKEKKVEQKNKDFSFETMDIEDLVNDTSKSRLNTLASRIKTYICSNTVCQTYLRRYGNTRTITEVQEILQQLYITKQSLKNYYHNTKHEVFPIRTVSILTQKRKPETPIPSEPLKLKKPRIVARYKKTLVRKNPVVKKVVKKK